MGEAETGVATVIDDVDGLVQSLFLMVADGLERVTKAFLDRDRDVARAIIARDTEFDTLQAEIEEVVEDHIAEGDAQSIPFLLSVLRIVPELERSGDLVEHIALRSAHGLVEELGDETRALVQDMGTMGALMWRQAAVAYTARDANAARHLRRLDDELDDLHVRLTTAITDEQLPTAAAIEMGLVARFYERLGDHAVNVVRRMRGLGTPPR